ncbi:hypothetical protein CWR43_12150 [Rhizobium sullae]|uniref:Uncharacterized protein n=1 Tax=Rhizobium sullae TaxID=50338 RepID=A0A2N0DC48_RHISU|nr:hypothetical protein CWR43_12150 [Rhizobium sullae]
MRHVSDRIMVIYVGKIIETGPKASIFMALVKNRPCKQYWKKWCRRRRKIPSHSPDLRRSDLRRIRRVRLPVWREHRGAISWGNRAGEMERSASRRRFATLD